MQPSSSGIGSLKRPALQASLCNAPSTTLGTVPAGLRGLILQRLTSGESCQAGVGVRLDLVTFWLFPDRDIFIYVTLEEAQSQNVPGLQSRKETPIMFVVFPTAGTRPWQKKEAPLPIKSCPSLKDTNREFHQTTKSHRMQVSTPCRFSLCTENTSSKKHSLQCQYAHQQCTPYFGQASTALALNQVPPDPEHIASASTQIQSSILYYIIPPLAEILYFTNKAHK